MFGYITYVLQRYNMITMCTKLFEIKFRQIWDFLVIFHLTIVGLILVSAGANRLQDVDPSLLSPVFHLFCRCLPDRLRSCVGYTHDYCPVRDHGYGVHCCGRELIIFNSINYVIERAMELPLCCCWRSCLLTYLRHSSLQPLLQRWSGPNCAYQIVWN